MTNPMDSASQLPSYVVVLRGEAALRFPYGEALAINQVPIPEGPIDIVYRSFYADEGFESPIPRGLWVDVRGQASSIDTALQTFKAAAMNLLPLLSLSANAPVSEPYVELAYETTSGQTRRQYIQRFLPAQFGLPPVSRSIDVPSTTAIFHAVFHINDAILLRRILLAATHYYHAFSYFRPGYDAIAISHLVMGIRTIAPAMEHISPNLTVASDEAILAAIEDKLIFHGDVTWYQGIIDLVHPFEYGLVDRPPTPPAPGMRDTTASYLREALLNLLRLDTAVRDTLLQGRYATPQESWPIARELRAYLIGDSDQLAMEDQGYPYVEWESALKSVVQRPTGERDYTFTDNFTNKCGEGISIEPTSYQLWGPTQTPPE